MHYYVFTDLPGDVPSNITLGVGRLLSIVKVMKFDRWQEISLRRMEHIQVIINNILHRYHIELKFIFSIQHTVPSRMKCLLTSSSLHTVAKET